jgi:hypothetical protein
VDRGAGCLAERLLDNHRVAVDRHVLRHGNSATARATLHPQLWICIHGGRLEIGGVTSDWSEGAVTWLHSSDGPPLRHTNVGSADIEFVSVTLKPLDPGAPAPKAAVTPLVYPNIPGEVVLDNDWLIAQRFVFPPGQWEGVHAHQPNMLFVHVRGGHWAARTHSEPCSADAEPSLDGSVGWMEPVGLEVGHESCNVGAAPIDLVWVSLKH